MWGQGSDTNSVDVWPIINRQSGKDVHCDTGADMMVWRVKVNAINLVLAVFRFMYYDTIFEFS